MHRHGTHDHAHDHGHGHGLAPDPRNRRALIQGLLVTVAFLVAEVIGGIVFSSLALLSDAVHMLTDAGALGLALFAIALARRPPTQTRSYGYARAEILAALINASTLIAASVFIIIEATQRLREPVAVNGSGVMLIAVLGLGANLFVAYLLLRADRSNLNVRAALAHALADAASSVGVIAAGAIIALTGYNRVDSLASYVIAALVLYGSWQLVRESTDILLDAVPAGMDTARVAEAMLQLKAVTEVHDLHIWTLGPGTPALSAHVRVTAASDTEQERARLRSLLQEQFGITHTTLQLSPDRSAQPIETVGQVGLSEAATWAEEHLAEMNPAVERGVIRQAVQDVAQTFDPDRPVSPVSLAVRAVDALGITHHRQGN